ncbi:septum formation initiator family protein [Aquihabitans sp. G128]|uniref:FtsB family cell division protein n=1 Tax=Aquihabitans sp. G128 TaxID=2849779 RepID=UPI001C2224A3|nr:septum formation initiator family protein [Aquihabitans sp. G128]QXC61018.1 septum formation initiator family protein [Aquihabitans sp. G128]
MRGQREGDRRRRNQARAQRRRRVVGALVATVMAVGVMYVALFPGQTLLAQRASTSKAESELREVQAQRKVVEDQARRLETDKEIEKQAREDFNMKQPGEEIVNVLPTQTDPIGLPGTWPFTGVERAFGAP